MSLEDWVKNTWLEKLESSPEEIKGQFSIADRCLDDYAKAGGLSADARLSIAHSAILASAAAALRAAGYRARRGGSEHYYTILALEFTVDPEKKVVYTLDALRKKRNQSLYDVSGNVSDSEATTLGKLAVQLRGDVEKWIRANHHELLK
jgi:hypothetical protein